MPCATGRPFAVPRPRVDRATAGRVEPRERPAWATCMRQRVQHEQDRHCCRRPSDVHCAARRTVVDVGCAHGAEDWPASRSTGRSCSSFHHAVAEHFTSRRSGSYVVGWWRATSTPERLCFRVHRLCPPRTISGRESCMDLRRVERTASTVTERSPGRPPKAPPATTRCMASDHLDVPDRVVVAGGSR